MKKNVASQVVGCQMVNASDGSAFTGAVTVFVTGDGGTQAQGSVGSGACTHEGNGFHTYAPAQAETNFDHVAFTFTGTGAVPGSVQIYTTFPQTGDSFARIGSNGAGLTAIDLPDQTMNITGNITGNLSGSVGSVTGLTAADVGAIKAKTDNLPSDPADASVVAGLIAAVEAKVDTVDGIVDDILLDTAEIGAAGAGLTNINLPNQTMDIVGNITGNITGNLSGSVGSVTGAVGSVTGNVGGNVAGSVASLTTNNDKTGYALSAAGSATLTEGYRAVGAGGTIPQLLYEILAMLTEKSISGTVVTTKKVDQSTDAATYDLDDDTTPSAITRAT